MQTQDSQDGRDRQHEPAPDEGGDGQVSETEELGSQDDAALGGADAVPETPDDNNPERDVPRTPH